MKVWKLQENTKPNASKIRKSGKKEEKKFECHFALNP
jgi:hypothetical protein